ncbi:MAG TPA: BrxA/BrxB family bacilliredoxin [Pyrinomonadaceae bacterium]|nr:BrxA/BrxB family bacilliredoxin [Pyrinomonadaceae bacterium]
MPYSEILIRPMREDLTRLGFAELKTTEQVDATVRDTDGTLLLVVNSVCGCAAGKARPGVALALQHQPRPERLGTVFAGADIEATARARAYFKDFPPSSPSIGLLKQGQLVFMMERHQIEGKDSAEVAAELIRAFDQHCTPTS